MTADDLPQDSMRYSFKTHIQISGFAGDLIISSTTVNDLVKSIKLLGHAGIEPTTAASQPAGAAPVCPVHQRPMKASRKPGSFFCTAKMDDGSYCKARV